MNPLFLCWYLLPHFCNCRCIILRTDILHNIFFWFQNMLWCNVLLIASLLDFSFPPLRSPSSSSTIIAFDGPTPQYPLCLLPHLRFHVLDEKPEVHIKMLAWPSPSEISCACIVFHFSHTSYRSFQYPSEQYHVLHPTKIYIFFLHW